MIASKNIDQDQFDAAFDKHAERNPVGVFNLGEYSKKTTGTLLRMALPWWHVQTYSKAL